MKKKISTISLALLSAFASVAVYKLIEKPQKEVIIREVASPKTKMDFTNMSTTNAAPNFVSAAASSVNAVVHIKTISSRSSNQRMDPWHEFFFGPGANAPQRQVEGSGSGVIISNDGYIVTNNHVIKGANEIEVVLNDKRNYTAKVIGTDPNTDIALIKIDEQELPFISYGNSDELQVGEWVLAVGNPFNLTSTVTAGIVSAKGRNINILREQFAIESFIQTDAAVNPGNSGGALVNPNGQLIGINTAIASNTGSYAGYSFAVPSNMVKKITDDLMSFGTVQRAFIGIQIQEVSKEKAEENGLDSPKGVYVAGLSENGAASDAGVKEGDIITAIAGMEVNSIPKLQEQVSKFRPGDKLDIAILREGNMLTLPITLKNKNGSTAIIKAEASVLGAMLAEIDDETKERLKIDHGVRIESIGSGKLLQQGIRSGFIITHIDNEIVKSAKDVKERLESKKGGVLIEGMYPNGTKGYYGFGL